MADSREHIYRYDASQIDNDSGVPGDYVDDALDHLDETKAPHENGFRDPSESALTFDEGTRTVTLTPTGANYGYYHNSQLYEVSSADSVVLPDTEGLWYVYYDGATMTYTDTFTPAIITDFAFITAIYWDATNNAAVYFGDERHGSTMDSATHSYNHNTFGARYDSGLQLTGILSDASGNLATSAQFGVANGVIWDEDIRAAITDGSPQTLANPAEIPMLYRSGAAGDWRKISATTFPVTTTGTGRAAWNENTGATWQLTEIGNNNFVLVHYYATPSITEPIIGIVGQNEYSTQNDARLGAETEINLLAAGALETLGPEFVPLATVIYQTSTSYSNAVKSRIRTTDTGADYVSWLVERTGTGFPAAPVNSVFGRTGSVTASASDYDASQVDNDSTVTGAFVDDALNTLSSTDGIGNASGVAGGNLTAALDQLDGDVGTNATDIADLAPQVLSKAFADSPYTIPAATRTFIQVNATGGTTLIYTPTAVAGAEVSIIKTDATAAQVRLLGSSGAKVNGVAGLIFGSQWSGGTYWCDGTDWFAK